MVANCLGFLVAGNETITAALLFVSYLLALNLNIQEKLQSEIDNCFEEKPASRILFSDVYDLSLLPDRLTSTCQYSDLFNEDPCTLRDGFNWQKWKQSRIIQLEKSMMTRR